MRFILKKTRISLFLILSFFISCSKHLTKSDSPLELEGLSYKKSIPLSYAKEFKVDEYIPEIESELRNFNLPDEMTTESSESSENNQKSSIYVVTISGTDRYLLLPKDCDVPKNLPSKVTVIRTPVTNTYLCASSAMALWKRLGSLDSIKFSAVQKKDWYVPDAARAMDEGKILYAGKYNAPDFELLLKENCSLAIESTMIYHTPQIKEKLESLEIPVFVDKSSYEENPLGRMEWIKLYGIMCTKLDVAENFFQNQVAKIENAVGEADTSTRLSDHKLKRHKKSVSFFYIISNGMVVIRGSEDYIVKMIEMAGGEYAFAFANTRKSSSPSVTISMEQFYSQCASSDILIYNSSIDNTLHSKADLLSKSPLFSDFKAVQNGEIWMTGKYLYQATDRIGDMILDLRAIITGQTEELSFLARVE